MMCFRSTARKSVVFRGFASSRSFIFTKPTMASAIVSEGDFLYLLFLLLVLTIPFFWSPPQWLYLVEHTEEFAC
jgi:hypothetical protein